MIYKKRLTLFFLFFLISGYGFGQIISSVEFIGLKRTKKFYVERFIDSRPGTDLDSVILAKDIQELKNLKLFENVEYYIYYGDSTVNIHFVVKEVYSLLPNFDIGFSNNILRLQTGFNDYNTFGRGGMTNFYIKYYERFSYILSGEYPYFFNQHIGLAFDLSKNSTIEPVYIQNTEKRIYNFDQWKALLYLRFDNNRKNYIKIGGGYMVDNYWRRDTAYASDNIDQNYDLRKIFIKASNMYNRLNYNFEDITGFSNELSLESHHFLNYHGEHYFRALNETKYFLKPYRTANTGIRLRLGYATDQPTPFLPFVQDDYVNLRGSGNRKARGYSEISINAEHRQTVYKNRFGTIGFVVFTDVGNVGNENFKGNSVFDPSYTKVFLGTGVRVFVSRLHGLVLRLDLATNLNQLSQKGFVGGVHQYF